MSHTTTAAASDANGSALKKRPNDGQRHAA